MQLGKGANEPFLSQEHSGAFLQKVRKTDVPDYYDGESILMQKSESLELTPRRSTVIKRPMDLATLLKRVKQQTYRTKKAFADDLDLIWSNCLLYNSHPVRFGLPCASRARLIPSRFARVIPSAAPPRSFDKSPTSSSSSLPTLPFLLALSTPLRSCRRRDRRAASEGRQRSEMRMLMAREIARRSAQLGSSRCRLRD